MKNTTDTTSTFTYTHETALPANLWEIVRKWAASRRRYRPSWCMNLTSVTVWLETPSTHEHNLAVRALSRSLDRAVMEAEFSILR